MKDTEYKYFNALSDILLNSINGRNNTVIKTLYRFFNEVFKKERDKPDNNPIVYPISYYELVYNTIEELASEPNRKYPFLERATAGSSWLIGELSGKQISEETFDWIWQNLLLIIRFQNDDMVMYHWATAHQYYSYGLNHIMPDYDDTAESYVVINSDEIAKREKERDRFIEFHNVLGGLLLYKQKYGLINRIFKYTQSEPPKYELLPETMSEIFRFYYKLQYSNDREYIWISNKYPFPEQSGLGADNMIKKWVASYMALLFIRQYSLQKYYIHKDPFSNPITPETQSEISHWIENLDLFKDLVNKHLNNPLLISTLGFEFLTREWCQENGKTYPTDYLDSLKVSLSQTYSLNQQTLPLSPEKISEFYNSTKRIIENTLDSLSPINQIEGLESDIDHWFVSGQRMLQSRDAFSENPEVHHIDFDSFLASIVSTNINRGIANTFKYKLTKSYLLKSEDVFKAIDKLGLTEEFTIIGFGFDLRYHKDYLKVPRLEESSYQNIEIHLFPGTENLTKSLFILRKTDLPRITAKDIQGDIIEKYSSSKISGKYDLYASVVDLNNATEDLLEENRQGKSDEEIKTSVLLTILLLIEIEWKKQVELIQIQQYTEYIQRGTPNKLSDVKAFDQG